jgi:uncharacterized protein YjbI with pentapeptide repeats
MNYQIKCRLSGKVLFSLEVESMKLCVMTAVESGADLYGADLYGADLYGADLSCANLSSANLSGADLGSEEMTRAVRGRSIDIRQLKLWGACEEGLAWVTRTLDGAVTCADLYAHGKDAYIRWMEGRVLQMILKERGEKSTATV